MKVYIGDALLDLTDNRGVWDDADWMNQAWSVDDFGPPPSHNFGSPISSSRLKTWFYEPVGMNVFSSRRVKR